MNNDSKILSRASAQACKFSVLATLIRIETHFGSSFLVEFLGTMKGTWLGGCTPQWWRTPISSRSKIIQRNNSCDKKIRIIWNHQENMISVHCFACAVSKRGAHLNHHVRHIWWLRVSKLLSNKTNCNILMVIYPVRTQLVPNKMHVLMAKKTQWFALYSMNSHNVHPINGSWFVVNSHDCWLKWLAPIISSWSSKIIPPPPKNAWLKGLQETMVLTPQI